MERMGISAWSTGRPRQEAEPSVSIKRRTLSFSISMYLEMTRIMSFLISLMSSGEQPALSATRRSFSRNLAVSLERLVFTLFHPSYARFSTRASLTRKPLASPGDSMGIFCLRACGIHSGKPVRRRTLFLPRFSLIGGDYDVFIIRNSAKDIHG